MNECYDARSKIKKQPERWEDRNEFQTRANPRKNSHCFELFIAGRLTCRNIIRYSWIMENALTKAPPPETSGGVMRRSKWKIS